MKRHPHCVPQAPKSNTKPSQHQFCPISEPSPNFLQLEAASVAPKNGQAISSRRQQTSQIINDTLKAGERRNLSAVTPEAAGAGRLSVVIDGVCVPITESNLMGMRVPTLKALAHQFGLKSGGKKGDLVERILEFSRDSRNADIKAQSAISSSSDRTRKKARREEKPNPVDRGASLQSTLGHDKVTSVNPESTYLQSQSFISSKANRSSQQEDFFPYKPGHVATRIPLRNCLCEGSQSFWPGPAIACSRCETRLHESCMHWDSVASLENNVPFICPHCRLQDLDPFLETCELLWMNYFHVNHRGVTILDQVETGETPWFQPVQFWLSAQNLHAWRRSNKEVVVRCVKLECPPNDRELLQQEWPRTLDVKLNHNVESVFAPPFDHKRRDNPLPITHYLKPGPNLLEVIASEMIYAGESKSFALGVLLCQNLDVNALVEKVKANSKETLADHTDRVSRFITVDQNDDDDVACVEKSRKMKLICPITLSRMDVPARGRLCQHLQCFDLESFISVTKNSKAFNTRWKCPECPRIVMPKDLVVDHFVASILQQTTDDDQIEIGNDGNWHIIERLTPLSAGSWSDSESDEASKRESTAAVSAKAPILIEDLDDDDDEDRAAVPPSQQVSLGQALRRLDQECSASLGRKRRRSSDNDYSEEDSFDLASSMGAVSGMPEFIDLSPSSSSSAAEITEPEEPVNDHSRNTFSSSAIGSSVPTSSSAAITSSAAIGSSARKEAACPVVSTLEPHCSSEDLTGRGRYHRDDEDDAYRRSEDFTGSQSRGSRLNSMSSQKEASQSESRQSSNSQSARENAEALSLSGISAPASCSQISPSNANIPNAADDSDNCFKRVSQDATSNMANCLEGLDWKELLGFVLAETSRTFDEGQFNRRPDMPDDDNSSFSQYTTSLPQENDALIDDEIICYDHAESTNNVASQYSRISDPSPLTIPSLPVCQRFKPIPSAPRCHSGGTAKAPRSPPPSGLNSFFTPPHESRKESHIQISPLYLNSSLEDSLQGVLYSSNAENPESDLQPTKALSQWASALSPEITDNLPWQQPLRNIPKSQTSASHSKSRPSQSSLFVPILGPKTSQSTSNDWLTKNSPQKIHLKDYEDITNSNPKCDRPSGFGDPFEKVICLSPAKKTGKYPREGYRTDEAAWLPIAFPGKDDCSRNFDQTLNIDMHTSKDVQISSRHNRALQPRCK